jgi:hypothetical protein
VTKSCILIPPAGHGPVSQLAVSSIIADSNQAQRHCAVGPSDRGIDAGAGKTPAAQLSAKLVRGSIGLWTHERERERELDSTSTC